MNRGNGGVRNGVVFHEFPWVWSWSEQNAGRLCYRRDRTHKVGCLVLVEECGVSFCGGKRIGVRSSSSSFGTKPQAPAARAAARDCSSLCCVRMTTRARGLPAMSWRVAANPSSTALSTSHSTQSGANSSNRCNASRPSRHSTTSAPSDLSNDLIIVRNGSWSSAIRIRNGNDMPAILANGGEAVNRKAYSIGLSTFTQAGGSVFVVHFVGYFVENGPVACSRMKNSKFSIGLRPC